VVVTSVDDLMWHEPSVIELLAAEVGLCIKESLNIGRHAVHELDGLGKGICMQIVKYHADKVLNFGISLVSDVGLSKPFVDPPGGS